MVPLTLVWLFTMFAMSFPKENMGNVIATPKLTGSKEDKGNVTATPKLTDKEYLPIVKWVQMSEDSVPSNAIYAGDEGPYKVYVCRARRENDTLPGKLLPALKTCYVPSRGEELFIKEYEVLVISPGVKVEWKPVSGNVMPPGIIQGGKTADGERLYIGRVIHDHLVCVGKIQSSDHYLYITLGRRVFTYSNYDVLVATALNFA